MALVCKDLATKAELQQLKDQINALLGQSADGSGTIDVLQAGSLAGTATAAGLTLAATAIQDIVIEGGAGAGSLWKDLASGAGKLTKVVGNGTKTVLGGLSTFGKTVGRGTGLAALGATVGSFLAQNASVLAFGAAGILQAGTTTASILVMDQRFDAQERTMTLFDYSYGQLVNILSDQNEDIDAANGLIAQAKLDIVELQQQNTELKTQADAMAVELVNRKTIIDQQKADIEILKASGLAIQAELEAYQADTQEGIDELKVSLATALSNLDNAIQQQDDLKEQIIVLEAKVAYLQDLSTFHFNQMILTDARLTKVETELTTLKAEIAANTDFTDSKLERLDGKLTLLGNRYKSVGGSGSFAAATGAATGQTKTLELAKNLAGSTEDTPVITTTDIYNGTTTFHSDLAPRKVDRRMDS